MKYYKFIIKILIISIYTICCSCGDNSRGNEPISENNKKLPQVAILGMLHFVSKNNAVSQKFTEVKSEKRQDEIRSIVELLKEYHPTKIAVERPYGSDAELNKAYSAYLNNKYELTEEETDQIAFRLGKTLNHKRLYLAYHAVEYTFDSVMAFAKKHGQSKIIDSILKNATELAKEYDSIATNKTIKDAIFYLNTPKAINKNHFGYLLLSQIGNKENKVGADAVGNWYKSNIKIFENIRQMANLNSDRILVIYGQGHCKIINQLIDDSPDLKLIKINEYLK